VRSVIYSMSVSLDGYIVGADGSFDWTMPSEEVFRSATDRTRELAAYVMGRRLFETMLVLTFSSRTIYLRYRLAPN
jgi:dihydrofolate reductase